MSPGSEEIVERTVGSTRVHLFDSHNHALLPWARLSREHGPLVLLSLDHHTDAMRPLRHHAHVHGWRAEEIAERTARRLARVDVGRDASVEALVRELHHDEQTKAAIALGVLRAAFVINYQQATDVPLSHEERRYLESLHRPVVGGPPARPRRPFTYPADALFVIGHGHCLPGCSKGVHDDDCRRRHYDAALEASLLSRRLAVADEMATTGLGWTSWRGGAYVLDLDLDYLHTRRSATPDDPTVLHGLIRGAVGITVAREPAWVKRLAVEGEELSSEWLEERLLAHVLDADRAPREIGPGASSGGRGSSR